MNKSSRKLDKKGFNNLSDKKWFDEWFENENFKPVYVDLPEKAFWQNHLDTLVLFVDKVFVSDALKIGKLAVEGCADEFDFVGTDKGWVIRLWWD